MENSIEKLKIVQSDDGTIRFETVENQEKENEQV